MLVYYFIPFIVSNRYLLFWVSNGHNSVTVQNRTHVYMNFFHHEDLGNHLLQLCPKVVKHPVWFPTVGSNKIHAAQTSWKNENGWRSYCASFLVYGENERFDCISAARFSWKRRLLTRLFLGCAAVMWSVSCQMGFLLTIILENDVLQIKKQIFQ